jgi:hypothetical protein
MDTPVTGCMDYKMRLRFKMMIIVQGQSQRRMKMNELTEREVYLISKVFQNYYCIGINEIAEEDETAKSLFEKIGLIERKEE